MDAGFAALSRPQKQDSSVTGARGTSMGTSRVFPPEPRMSIAGFQKITSDLAYQVEGHAVALRDRGRCLPKEKVHVLVPSPGLRCNRQQIWRFAVHAAVLRVTHRSNPNMKIKSVLSGQLANERRPI